MAEAVFQHLVNEAGLSDQITVDSAGTGEWHVGERAHQGTLKVLSQHGIEYNGRARQINHADFDRFDYILAMDHDNLTDLEYIRPDKTQAVIKRFLEFANNPPKRDVPDPYYNGRFEEVYSLVRQGAEGLLAYIRAEKGL
jgi:protein-tyrosine phosphatase